MKQDKKIKQGIPEKICCAKNAINKKYEGYEV